VEFLSKEEGKLFAKLGEFVDIGYPAWLRQAHDPAVSAPAQLHIIPVYAMVFVFTFSSLWLMTI